MTWRGSVTALSCGLLALSSMAQTACPSTQAISADQLIGVWEIELHSQPPQRWPLKLQAHPEHTGSLQGRLVQGTRTALVVADWDDGEFTMEESHDGQRIAATWLGTATEGLCGRQIEGTRQHGEAAAPTRFTMRADRLR